MNENEDKVGLPELATKVQVAAYCQVSPRTISRYVRRGLLAQVKLGEARQSAVRFRRTDVLALVERHHSHRKGEDHDFSYHEAD